MSDLIDRQAAIDAFNTNIDELVVSGKENADAVERYLNRVIDEIKQLPPILPVNNSENPNSSDVISRQAAIDALDGEITITGQANATAVKGYVNLVKDRLERLPSAQPEQRTGKWIKLDMHRGMADHKCTACEQECYVPTCMGEPMYAFCPNCGAKMEVTT